MNALRLFLVLVLVLIGLVNRRHFKPPHDPPVRTRTTQTAVDKELLQNAERLAETLRRCKETAHNNRQTK